MEWYSSSESSFGADVDAPPGGGFGVNVFLRDGDRIFRTYFIADRADEQMGGTWNYLDITPLGRQELWQDVPAGRPQGSPYEWWRLHDNYGDVAHGITSA